MICRITVWKEPTVTTSPLGRLWIYHILSLTRVWLMWCKEGCECDTFISSFDFTTCQTNIAPAIVECQSCDFKIIWHRLRPWIFQWTLKGLLCCCSFTLLTTSNDMATTAEFYNAKRPKCCPQDFLRWYTDEEKTKCLLQLASTTQHLWLKKTYRFGMCRRFILYSDWQWLKAHFQMYFLMQQRSFFETLAVWTSIVLPDARAIFHDWCTKYHVSRKPQSKLLAFWGQGGCAANTYKVGRVFLTAWKPYKCNWLPYSLLGCFLNIWAIENRPSLLRQYWTIENKWRAEPIHRPADFFKFADKVFLDGWFWPWDVCLNLKQIRGHRELTAICVMCMRLHLVKRCVPTIKPKGTCLYVSTKRSNLPVFLAQFMWNKPFLSMFLQSQTLSSLFFVSVNHGAANDPRFRGRYREKWERSGIVLTTRSVAHKLLVFSLPPSSVPARMTCGCSHATTKTRHDFKFQGKPWWLSRQITVHQFLCLFSGHIGLAKSWMGKNAKRIWGCLKDSQNSLTSPSRGEFMLKF